MARLIFRRSFWTLRDSDAEAGPGDASVLVFGGVFLVACVVIFTGMMEPQWFIGAPNKPRLETKAELAWDVLVRRYRHEQRLCTDADELDKASDELQQERVWNDVKSAGDAADTVFDADMARQQRLLDCLGKIAPLPSPP